MITKNRVWCSLLCVFSGVGFGAAENSLRAGVAAGSFVATFLLFVIVWANAGADS